MSDYNARYYSARLGRFVSADTIVPDFANPQQLKRFSYVLNSPIAFTDPSGHFSPEAIKEYLKSTNSENWQEMYQQWQDDGAWWEMITTAQAGDILFGGRADAPFGGGYHLTFEGSGREILTGFNTDPINQSGIEFSPEGLTGFGWTNATLNDIRLGTPIHHRTSRPGYAKTEWVGLLTLSANGGQPIINHRDIYASKQVQTDPRTIIVANIVGVLGLAGAGTKVDSGYGPQVASGAVSFGLVPLIADVMDRGSGDLNVFVGDAYFNFQRNGLNEWALETYTYNNPFRNFLSFFARNQ